MTWLDLIAVPLLAKICLVSMFPLSAFDKVVHWGEAMDQAKSGPLPFPALLLISGIAVEAVTPALIVIGLWDRAAAFMLAGFCVITALMYHQFWRFSRFWSKNGEGRAHLWDFFKNFGLVGGLLLVVIGGSYAPVSQVAAHPLSNGPTSVSSILDHR